MPRPRRIAAQGTVEAVLEDLRFSREAGGLKRAGTTELQATLRMIFPEVTTFTDEHLMFARALIETHINQACDAYRNSHPDDPGRKAAAASLRALLFQSPEDTSKALVVRKQALKDHGCPLSPDGVRKREDAVLATVSRVLHRDVLARQGHTPQTIEELVRLMRPVAKELQVHLHKSLLLIYPFDPKEDETDVDWIMAQALWLAARVLAWSRSVLILHQRPVAHSRSDVLFATIAQSFLLLASSEGTDKGQVYEVLKRPGIDDEVDLWNAVLALPDGNGILNRWRSWMASCYETCTYHRSMIGGKCQPHHLAQQLEIFESLVADLEAGVLEQTMVEEYGTMFPSPASLGRM